MTPSELEGRVRTALTDEARSYRASAELWEGVVDGVGRPFWRGRPLHGAFAAAAVAAALVAAVLLWPGAERNSVTVGPAADTATTAAPSPPPPPPGQLPSWAYPFLAVREGAKELFLVNEEGTSLVAGDSAGGLDYAPIGLAGGNAVFLRRPHEDVFGWQLVIAPDGGPEQTADVTGASLSPDRTRVAYVSRDGRTPTDVVVQDVLGGNQRRVPLTGSRFAARPLLLVPRLVGDMLMLEYIGEHSSPDDGVWALDLRTAASAAEATKWPPGISNVVAYDERHVVAEQAKDEDRVPVVIDVKTRKVVRTLPPPPIPLFLQSDGRGHLVGVGSGLHVYDGGTWIPVPGWEFAAW